MNSGQDYRASPSAKRFAGQPLYALFGVLVLYAAMRAYWWETPFEEMLPPLAVGVAESDSFVVADSFDAWGGQANVRANDRVSAQRVNMPVAFSMARPTTIKSANPNVARGGVMHSGPYDNGVNSHRAPPLEEPIVRPKMATDNPALRQAKASGGITIPDVGEGKRWSLNGWLLYRPESATAPLLGSGQQPSTYGASQAGAVLRYRLAPSNAHRPAAYIRLTSALGNTRDQEVAAGVSARPMPKIPVVIAAEARASRQDQGSEIRPAVFAYTEIPRISLPYQFRAEVYAQAGYIGGDFATPFADGQARIDRKLATTDFATIRTGGGVWGGAQQGAERLDIGPSVRAEFDIAGAPVTLSADYRYRVAGGAAPQSGAAITLSTGF